MRHVLLVLLTLASVASAISSPIVTKVKYGLVPFGDSNTEKNGMVLIDAGSSGTKIFAFFGPRHEEERVQKLETRCDDAAVKDGSTNRGVAALAYSKEECRWQVGVNSTDLKPLEAVSPDFVDLVLGLLSQTYANVSQDDDLSHLANAGSVPMLATAGMRLLSQAANEKVWHQICNKKSAGLTMAAYGEACGTIPGTTEAYYEYLANAVHGEGERVLTGTFTVGGASAQIAIPLKTKKDVQDFLAMKADIAKELDCTKLLLQDGSPAPIFFTKQHPTEAKLACIDDYITFRPRSQIKASVAVLGNNVRVQELQGLGLVSFLSLQGRGSFLAGGINEIGHWARKVGCNSNTSTFDACSKKLQVELQKDVMWKHVTAFFRQHALNIRSFSYNSFASIPARSGLLEDKKDRSPEISAWRLIEELEEKCGADNGKRFGYQGTNTCLKAYFTALYTTSFFAPAHEQNRTQHVSTELHSDSNRDWSEGKLQTLSLAQINSYTTMQTAMSLLHIPLQRHSSSYLEGARLHLMSKPSADRRSMREVQVVSSLDTE